MTATPIDQPTDAFCEVFRVAFELTADEDRSYRTAFLHSRPPADVQTSHVVVALDGDPVAVASLHRTPSTSFLYNIGTSWPRMCDPGCHRAPERQPDQT